MYNVGGPIPPHYLGLPGFIPGFLFFYSVQGMKML